jgi:hypothetical protein
MTPRVRLKPCSALVSKRWELAESHESKLRRICGVAQSSNSHDVTGAVNGILRQSPAERWRRANPSVVMTRQRRGLGAVRGAGPDRRSCRSWRCFRRGTSEAFSDYVRALADLLPEWGRDYSAISIATTLSSWRSNERPTRSEQLSCAMAWDWPTRRARLSRTNNVWSCRPVALVRGSTSQREVGSATRWGSLFTVASTTHSSNTSLAKPSGRLTVIGLMPRALTCCRGSSVLQHLCRATVTVAVFPVAWCQVPTAPQCSTPRCQRRIAR